MHITRLKIHAIAPTPAAKPKAHTVISYKLLPPIMEKTHTHTHTHTKKTKQNKTITTKQKQSILTFKNSAKGDKSIKEENAPLAYAFGKSRQLGVTIENLGIK